MRRAREVLRPGSLAVIICDERALGDAAEQQLTLLARHVDLLLVPVFDPLDHALPAAGLLRFAQFGARLELDSHDAAIRQAYRLQGEARTVRWRRLADRLRLPLMPLDTQRDLIDQLREHLSVQHPGAHR